MEKNGYTQYSHFGTVCVPVLDWQRNPMYRTSVMLRKGQDGKIHAFVGGKDEMTLSLETAKRLKRGSLDPYIDASGKFYSAGYNNRVNGENRRR